MGVTVHHFAFDPDVHTGEISLKRWLEQGMLNEDLTVTPQGQGSLREIESVLGDNKMWYRNQDARWAWSLAREHLDSAYVAQVDHLLAHMFYTDADITCEHTTRSGEGEFETIYDSALIRHVLELWTPLDDVREEPRRLNQDDASFQESRDIANYSGMFEADGFEWLVNLWMDLFERVHKRSPGWSLFEWVWI